MILAACHVGCPSGKRVLRTTAACSAADQEYAAFTNYIDATIEQLVRGRREELVRQNRDRLAPRSG